MIRKVTFILALALMVSCARNSSIVSTSSNNGGTNTNTYSQLWIGLGGNSGATNVVTSDLPVSSFDIKSGSSESGFIVYASPVIYKDTLTNAQYVLVLWANDSQLKLVRYAYTTDTLTKDTNFGTNGDVLFNATAANKMAYQISLNIESSNPFVYVAHANGITKVNAVDGSQDALVSFDSGVFRVLADGDNIYFQTPTSAVKSNVSLSTLTTQALPTTFSPTKQLPIISNDGIYFFQDDTHIVKVASDFTSSTTETPTTGYTVANAAQYSNSIVYILHQLKAIVAFGQTSSDSNKRRASAVQVKQFGATLTTNYDSNNKATTYAASTNDTFAGDVSFKALAVNTGSDQLYLPVFGSDNYIAKQVTDNSYISTADRQSYTYTPFSWNTFSSTELGLTSGLVRATTTSFASIFPSNQQLIGYGKIVSGITVYTSFYKVSRFVLVGSDATVLSVSNVPEELHASTDLYGNTIQSSHGSSTPNDKVTSDNDRSGADWGTISATLYTDANQTATVSDANALNTYNTQILLGDSSSVATQTFTDTDMAAYSVAAGAKMVILSGSDGNLYVID
ncbi:MAG: hypothetical protein VW397_05530 [Candidatus Margulisiibacteriota bacterium]